jgi:hypothetical protein
MMSEQDVEITRCYNSITYYNAINGKGKSECGRMECRNLLISKNNSILVRIIKKLVIELVDWRDDLSTAYDLMESNFVKCINWDLIDPKLVNFYYENLEIKNPIVYDSRCIPVGTFGKVIFPVQYTEDLISKLKSIEDKSQLFSYLLFPFCKEENIKVLEHFKSYNKYILKFAVACSSANVVKWVLDFSDITDITEEFGIKCACTDVSFDVFKILAEYIAKNKCSLTLYINKCENADLFDRIKLLQTLE